MDDERLYTQVVQELRVHGSIPGLWAKAYAEANGNKPQAEALYLRYRVEQLAEAERQSLRKPVEDGKDQDRDDLYTEVTSNISAHAPYLIGIVVLVVILVVAFSK